jgi:hypothetical protein
MVGKRAAKRVERMVALMADKMVLTWAAKRVD